MSLRDIRNSNSALHSGTSLPPTASSSVLRNPSVHIDGGSREGISGKGVCGARQRRTSRGELLRSSKQMWERCRGT